MKTEETFMGELPLTMSPEQAAIVNNLETVSTILFNDSKVAAETIAISALIAFTRGENSLIICPDSMVQAHIQNWLNQYVSKSWVRIADISEAVNDSEIPHFKQCTHNQFIANTAELKKKQFSIEHKYLDLINQILFSNQIIWQGQSIKDLYYIYSPDKSDPCILSMLYFVQSENPEWNETELNKLLKEVNLAQRLFPGDDYVLYSNSNDFFSDIDLSTESDCDLVTEWCKFHLDEILQLKKEYISFLKNYTSQINQKNFVRLRAIEKKLKEIEFLGCLEPEEFSTYSDKKPKFNVLFKHTKHSSTSKEEAIRKLIEEVEQEILNLTGNTATINFEDSIDISQFVKSYRAFTENFFNDIEKRTYNSVMSLNSKNTAGKSIYQLEIKLRNSIESINEKGFFKTKLEINTISLVKQTEYISKIENLLTDAISNLRIKKLHIDWHGFFTNSSILFKKIFPHIVGQPRAKWSEKVKSWYLNALIENKLKSYIPYNTHSNLDEVADQYMSTFIESAEIDRLKLISNKQTEWSESHKSLWNDIFRKKKIKDRTWRELLELHSNFIAQYYPILILNNDNVRKIDTGSYKHIFYLDYNQQNPEILQSFQTIHSYYKKGNMGKLETDLTVLLPSVQNSKAIRELALSERLPLARNISDLLMSVHPELKFFQTKNFNIISCLSKVCSEILEDILSDSGIKEIYIENDVKEHIIESLLETDRSQILLVENGLISENCPYLLWQRHVLEEFSISGFEVISMDFHEMADFDGNYLKSKLAHISVKQNKNPFKTKDAGLAFV